MSRYVLSWIANWDIAFNYYLTPVRRQVAALSSTSLDTISGKLSENEERSVLTQCFRRFFCQRPIYIKRELILNKIWYINNTSIYSKAYNGQNCHRLDKKVMFPLTLYWTLLIQQTVVRLWLRICNYLDLEVQVQIFCKRYMFLIKNKKK